CSCFDFDRHREERPPLPPMTPPPNSRAGSNSVMAPAKPALEPADSQLPLRQDCQDRLQVLRIGLELADAVAAHGCDHRAIHRGLDTAQAPLVADVAV